MAELIAFTIIATLAVISPGPDFAMITRNCLTYSRRTGIYTSLGISLGLLVHVIYSLVGIGFIITKSIILFNIIKYIGAAYLVYIGFMSLQSRKKGVTEEHFKKEEKDLPRLQAAKIGFLTNVLNPKATVFFLSVFTQVVSPTTPIVIQFVYGIEIMAIAFVWFSTLSILLTQSAVKNRISKVQHYFERAMGAALVALGVKVAVSSSD